MYSTYTLTTIGDEPILFDLEIIDEGSCIIEARKTPKTKQQTENVIKNNKTENITKQVEISSTHDIEYELELTKRLEIEKNFQLEMRKLDLRRLEIDHEYQEKYLKKNT